MQRINFTARELLVLRDSIHNITIKGTDAVLVGELLTKVYKSIAKESDMSLIARTTVEPTGSKNTK